MEKMPRKKYWVTTIYIWLTIKLGNLKLYIWFQLHLVQNKLGQMPWISTRIHLVTLGSR